MIVNIIPLLIGLISLSCTDEKSQESSKKTIENYFTPPLINASSPPGSSTPSPKPLDTGCISTGERVNVCVLTAAKTYESRDPNFNKKSCWLRDSESEVDNTLCAGKSVVELRLGAKCGGTFKNFGFIDPSNELIGKTCGYIGGGVPQGRTVIVNKWSPVSGEKRCAELGLKSGDVCPSQGISCSIDYDQICDQLPQKPKLRAAESLTCQPWDSFNCPISTAEAKKNIVYLDEARKKIIAEEILNLKLANYEYKSDTGEPAGLNLGFIIEDAPNASFIIQGVKRVNLYTYISSAVATIQLQENRIRDLEAAVARLEKANRN